MRNEGEVPMQLVTEGGAAAIQGETNPIFHRRKFRPFLESIGGTRSAVLRFG
jgi:hypothetical protein